MSVPAPPDEIIARRRNCFAYGAIGADSAAPAFHMDAGVACLEIGDELLPPPSGPGPVTNDPRYPYVDNGAARRRGIQPTYRVAGLGKLHVVERFRMIDGGKTLEDVMTIED